MSKTTWITPVGNTPNIKLQWNFSSFSFNLRGGVFERSLVGIWDIVESCNVWILRNGNVCTSRGLVLWLFLILGRHRANQGWYVPTERALFSICTVLTIIGSFKNIISILYNHGMSKTSDDLCKFKWILETEKKNSYEYIFKIVIGFYNFF